MTIEFDIKREIWMYIHNDCITIVMNIGSMLIASFIGLYYIHE